MSVVVSECRGAVCWGDKCNGTGPFFFVLAPTDICSLHVTRGCWGYSLPSTQVAMYGTLSALDGGLAPPSFRTGDCETATLIPLEELEQRNYQQLLRRQTGRLQSALALTAVAALLIGTWSQVSTSAVMAHLQSPDPPLPSPYLSLHPCLQLHHKALLHTPCPMLLLKHS